MNRTIATACGAVIALAGLFAFATPAQAHNYLVSSTPADGSTVTELPARFEIRTNDNLLDLGDTSNAFRIEVKGPADRYYGDGCVLVQGPSASMAAELGPAGAYTMLWQVVSADGHPVSGEVTFKWEPTANTQLSNGATAIPDCHGTLTTDATPGQREDDGSDGLATVLWIGGGILAVSVAAVTTILVLSRPRKKN